MEFWSFETILRCFVQLLHQQIIWVLTWEFFISLECFKILKVPKDLVLLSWRFLSHFASFGSHTMLIMEITTLFDYFEVFWVPRNLSVFFWRFSNDFASIGTNEVLRFVHSLIVWGVLSSNKLSCALLKFLNWFAPTWSVKVLIYMWDNLTWQGVCIRVIKWLLVKAKDL